MNNIRKILQNFNKIELGDLDKVKLMNRIDQKFCLNFLQLPSVLKEIRDKYMVLDIDGENIFKYRNIYFDTNDNQMFLFHQNGKRNRCKIRFRQYVNTDDNFLEVKQKNNKGRTIKERIVRENLQIIFDKNELNFIEETSPYSGEELLPKISSKFYRITLVNNQFTERVTIDLSLDFKNNRNTVSLDNLVIVEVKQNRSEHSSSMIKALKQKRVRKNNFSKYCIGRSLLEDKIKKNNFKPLLLKISREYMN